MRIWVSFTITRLITVTIHYCHGFIVYSQKHRTVATRLKFWHIFDRFLISLMCFKASGCCNLPIRCLKKWSRNIKAFFVQFSCKNNGVAGKLITVGKDLRHFYWEMLHTKPCFRLKKGWNFIQIIIYSVGYFSGGRFTRNNWYILSRHRVLILRQFVTVCLFVNCLGDQLDEGLHQEAVFAGSHWHKC